ncbi:hypothetical protein [Clostridium beijerinckii]|uniref:hypothetical protein n=1 Tax=Clostridium beijerinckii TaxID=1520 RepID=UPI00098C08BE|nr:hypothetical protein [Clostridium beijerinckii]MBA8937213.1 hypothetical protein [Clostridium beijerinckii]NRU40321.1 hypothetical protein [Clostridium beijerinckii]NSA96402.1 hypothetical protein [Clostridium beijerinckii]OOM66035.1 hypothetical protein CLOBI_08750 [Clostridium beijerinckii]OOM72070.1 hypothetical protein CLBEIC_08150 [Clostridium beijerinckii]
MSISIIKDYLPVITAVVVAFLTYLLGLRKRKKDKFNLQMEVGLKEILSPMFNTIRVIKREESAFQREKLLKNFFEKYSYQDTNVFEIPSRIIHDLYYECDNLFLKFIKERSDDSWDAFWIYFDRFDKEIVKEYKTIRENVYLDYKWLMCLNEKNYFIRIFLEACASIFEMAKVLIMGSCIVIFIIIMDNIQGKKTIPDNTIIWVSMTLIGSLLVYGLLRMTILIEYCLTKQMQLNRKNINIDIEKEKKKIKIPKMYKK